MGDAMNNTVTASQATAMMADRVNDGPENAYIWRLSAL